MKKTGLIISLLAAVVLAQGQEWRTHFAYNNVTQIAMAKDRVYAISDGSLFSVEKQSEKIQTYDRLSGLHFSNIEKIGYDSISQSLLIIYSMGHIDVLSDTGTYAIDDYFLKDITSDKHVNNITFHNGSAYLATEFGVLRFSMRDYTFLECCYIGDNASEISVQDILFNGDSIYAKTKSIVYSANLKDNILDYRFWHVSNTPQAWNAKKGIEQTDVQGDTWNAGGTEGLVRTDILGTKVTYIPNGPSVNYFYRIRGIGDRIGAVQGSYTRSFGYKEGLVMTLENGVWRNYSQAYMQQNLNIKDKNGKDKISTDYCDIAFDPKDPSHFFVASFGYGLIEFRNNEFYKHHHPDNSAVEAVWQGGGFPYVWVDGLRYDSEGNLWMTNICTNGIKVLTKDSTWVSISNAACSSLTRAQDLIISNTNANIKIVSNWDEGIGIMDDNGTIEDQSDDRAVYTRATLVDEQGNLILSRPIRVLFQSSDGALWIGTESGLYRIESPESLFEGNRLCPAVIIAIQEEDIDNAFGTEHIQSIAEDNQHRIWVGTENSGLFCISEDRTHIIHHYTGANSPLLSNNVKSLYAPINSETITLYIGTSGGILTYYEEEDDQQSTGTNSNVDSEISYGSMKGWKTHFSNNNISSLEEAGHLIYGVADGALISLDKETEELSTLSKLTGLQGSDVALISHNEQTSKTLVLYKDGLIDIISKDGQITNMPDLFLKTGNHPSDFISAYSFKDQIYICAQMGIINVNMRKNEIAETYVLRDENKDITINAICILNDSIYAVSEHSFYSAALSDNLIDYSNWKLITTSSAETIHALSSTDEKIYIHSDSNVYIYDKGVWAIVNPSKKWETIYVHNNIIIGKANDGLFEINGDSCSFITNNFSPNDILKNGRDYWIALRGVGIVRWNASDGSQQFETNSPYENLCYRIRIANDKLIMLPGGYFAEYYFRPGNIMIKEGSNWTNYTHDDITMATGGYILSDFCDAAIDPEDPSHFFIASFGYGLLEFRDNKYYKLHTENNTINGLESVLPGAVGYTWVDGLCYDSDGNLWMLNNSESGVKVLLRNGQWVRFNNIATRNKNRTQDLLIWKKDSNVKILSCARVEPGIGIFDDNGTISNKNDDKAVFWSSFIDQQGKKITPQFIYSICQKVTGEVWVGTENGLIILPDIRKLLNGDNHCQRIIIPRNDGTGLGDYLLGNEQINCMEEDGGGRIWIGTENSGLYLISDDGQQILEHFTKSNSPLASNSIYSIAIHPSGEVFIGTSRGLMSYQSDASEAQADLDSIFAYPNPVYKNYNGFISITGLMENTIVNIIDEAGNLICKTRSNGGIAVWDGCDAKGKRALPGVYTALCNAEGKHNVCKILILHAAK